MKTRQTKTEMASDKPELLQTSYGQHRPVVYDGRKFTVAVDRCGQPNGVFDHHGGLLPYDIGQPICEATISQWADEDDGDTGEARSVENNETMTPTALENQNRFLRQELKNWTQHARQMTAQRDELLAALKECRMALTLDYHGCTKPKKALCDLSPAASQAHNKAVLAIQECEGANR